MGAFCLGNFEKPFDKLRLTKSEAAAIQECADKLKITRTDAIMKGILRIREEWESFKQATNERDW